MKTVACSIWTILAVVAPAAAETDTSMPRSLHMRPIAEPPPTDPDGAPASTPTVDATPNLSGEALQQLAARAARGPRFTVTGSRIERTTLMTPAPMTILRREDLDAAGHSSLGDILLQLPAQAGVTNPQAYSGDDGRSRADLRGLGSTRTLTLVNGRRVVAGATGMDGSADVSTIPLAVIERVEILKAGASAVYGSDAAGGVVNIITRNAFEGTEASLYTAASQHDGGFLYDASFVTGHNVENQKGNILFSAGMRSQDPVFTDDRSFSKDDGAYHSLVTTGDRAFPPVNSLHAPAARYSLYSAGSYELRPEVSGFFESSYVNSTSDHPLAREPSSTSGLLVLGSDVLAYDRRPATLGVLRSRQDIATFRTVAGLRGAIPDDAPAFKDWTWEVSYEYGRSDGTNESAGDLSASRLANAPTFTSSGFIEQQTLLATTHGRIATLPNHGELSVAAGTDVRAEAAGLPADPLRSTGGTIGGTPLPAEATDHVLEGFGELSLVPISGQELAQWVELDLAARGFRYDSSGSGVAWNAGGLYRMVDGFAVRGTYAMAFRAPSAVELSQDHGEDRRNPTGAETAKVLTAGVVFEPPRVKGLSLTADYWDISITKPPPSFAASVVISNCYTRGLAAYCDLIHRDPASNYAIDYIENPFASVPGTSTSGLDTAVVYDHKLGELGRLHERLEAQVLFEYTPDGSRQALYGRADNGVDLVPAVKASFSSAWQHPSGAGAGLDLRYVGSFTQCYEDDCSGGAVSRDVDAWYKVDLFGSYTVQSSAGSTILTVGINNLLGDSPPHIYVSDLGAIGGYRASIYDYDYLGRFFYTRLSHRF